MSKSYGKMNTVSGDETNGYEATRIYRENASCGYKDGGCMAGMKGKSGPPGNMNAFKHGMGSHSETASRTLNICSAW
jgi:hypothetical protein